MISTSSNNVGVKIVAPERQVGVENGQADLSRTTNKDTI